MQKIQNLDDEIAKMHSEILLEEQEIEKTKQEN